MSERRRPKEKPMRRDKNGNSRVKWKRKSGRDFGKTYTEYSVNYGKTQLDVWTWSDWNEGPEKKPKPYHYRVTENGKTVAEGWEDSALGAKVAAEREADGR